VEKRKDRITRILSELSEMHSVPYSTLKFNAKVLKDLELLDYGTAVDPVDVRLTDLGRLVLAILREGVENGEAHAPSIAQVEAQRHGF